MQWEDDFFDWQSEVPAAEADEDSLRPLTHKDRCSFSCTSCAQHIVLSDALRSTYFEAMRELLGQLTPNTAQERGAEAPSIRTAQAPCCSSKRRPRRLF